MKSQLPLFGQPENDVTESDRKTPKLIHADCLDAMREMPDASIDVIVTDPPYGLEFMGKKWDSFGQGWQAGGSFAKPGIGERQIAWPSFSATGKFGAANPTCGTCGGRLRGAKKCSCAEPNWKPIGKRRNPENEGLPDDMAGSGSSRQSKAFQDWCEEWAREALRVAKPGAYLVAFGGTRMYHRLACAIEDAGWEIRDCLSWLYGSGFPKSLDVSKAIDKAAGAERKIIGTRKLTGNAAQSTKEKGGTYASNTNSVGVVPIEVPITAPATDAARAWQGWGTALKPAWEPIILARKPLVGTVAANVLAHGTGAINVDACRIGDFQNMTPSGVDRRNAKLHELGYRPGEYPTGADEKTPNTPPGRWPANVALDEEAAAMLDEQTGTLTSGKASTAGHRRKASMGASTGAALEGNADGSLRSNEDAGVLYGDSGGASRFFYTAKASRRERGEGNTHPTVKPLALMRWLVKLVTPPGGVVLDPFAGSGTTLLAAQAEGFDAVGIEREAEYVEIARKRIQGAGEPK